jgi:hypothetical protein
MGRKSPEFGQLLAAVLVTIGTVPQPLFLGAPSYLANMAVANGSFPLRYASVAVDVLRLDGVAILLGPYFGNLCSFGVIVLLGSYKRGTLAADYPAIGNDFVHSNLLLCYEVLAFALRRLRKNITRKVIMPQTGIKMTIQMSTLASTLPKVMKPSTADFSVLKAFQPSWPTAFVSCRLTSMSAMSEVRSRYWMRPLTCSICPRTLESASCTLSMSSTFSAFLSNSRYYASVASRLRSWACRSVYSSVTSVPSVLSE